MKLITIQEGSKNEYENEIPIFNSYVNNNKPYGFGSNQNG